MGKFLAIFNGAADDADKAQFTEQQQTEFMNSWAAWAGTNQHALVDPGAPLNLNPHLGLVPENSIEILEWPPIPS